MTTLGVGCRKETLAELYYNVNSNSSITTQKLSPSLRKNTPLPAEKKGMEEDWKLNLPSTTRKV